MGVHALPDVRNEGEARTQAEAEKVVAAMTQQDNQHCIAAPELASFKLEARHFRAAWEREKCAEVRMIDPEKPIDVGDRVWLREWVPEMGFRGAPSVTQYAAHYTGRALRVLVTHMVTAADVPALLTDDVHVWSFSILERHDTDQYATAEGDTP